MRNTILVIVLFFTLSSYTQESFNFNLLTIYNIEEGKDLEKNYDEVILTDNSSNIITAFRNRKNKLVAIIRTKEKVNHYFHLINDNDDILNPTNFEYQFSVEFKNSDCFHKNSEYEVVKLKDSSNNYNTKVSRYFKLNKNNIDSILYLDNIESKHKYYTNFRESYLYHFDSCNKLHLGSNLIVKSAEIHCSDKRYNQKITLIKNDLIDLKISIPKLKYRSIRETLSFNQF